MSKYQTRFEEFFEERPDFVQPAKQTNEVLGWVKAEVRYFSVSRAHSQRRILVPHDESWTVYVWFDILLGYISALLSDDGSATTVVVCTDCMSPYFCM